MIFPLRKAPKEQVSLSYRDFAPYTITHTKYETTGGEGVPLYRLSHTLHPDDSITVYDKDRNALIGTTVKRCTDKNALVIDSTHMTRHERKMKKTDETFTQMVKARDEMLAQYCSWEHRANLGDPFFDQWMVDASEAALNAVIAMDRAICTNFFAVEKDSSDYPQESDEVYQITKEVIVHLP